MNSRLRWRGSTLAMISPLCRSQRREDRPGAVAHLFVVTRHKGVHAGHRRQIGRGHAKGLHARFLIDADGVIGTGRASWTAAARDRSASR